MKDIELAIKHINDMNNAIVIVKNGMIIYESKDKGIKPLYEACETLGETLNGATLADRVTGRAAAILCAGYGIKALHTKLLSERAVEILKDGNVEFSYEKIVPYIKNRNQTDTCPVEKISKDINNVNELMIKIKSFLDRMST